MTSAVPPQGRPSWAARICRWSGNCSVIDGTGRPQVTQVLSVRTWSRWRNGSAASLRRRLTSTVRHRPTSALAMSRTIGPDYEPRPGARTGPRSPAHRLRRRRGATGARWMFFPAASCQRILLRLPGFPWPCRARWRLLRSMQRGDGEQEDCGSNLNAAPSAGAPPRICNLQACVPLGARIRWYPSVGVFRGTVV